MRTRRNDWGLSLDSFFDILTNVVGVMVLIALLTVLSTGDITVRLGTPVLHDPPRNADPIYFECRENQIFPIEPSGFMEEFQERLKDELERDGPFVTRADVERVLEGGDFGDAYYKLKGDSSSLFLEPRPWVAGQTIRKIGASGSDYLEKLTSLDADEHYLYFLVREDSFGVFRRARGLARDRGVSTGWVPLSKDELLRLGGGSGHKIQ